MTKPHSLHTPGPWRVARHTTKVSVYADAMERPHNKSPHKGGVVASMLTTWDSAQAGRALADATLIAAAPDLYEALSAIVAEADNPHGDSIAVTTLAQRVGRAALAKAGQQ